ncbi:MAG: hypothetical protein A2V86_08285 [Deltaproteobacteria bacterium RBG_16_49_23]|nr:MAG: hypothetical protein A2V86_08285 [Deltaproteobacteria bacterium RBG_16_49_23]
MKMTKYHPPPLPPEAVSQVRSWFDRACPERTVRPFESLKANGFFPNVLSKVEGRAQHERKTTQLESTT